MQVKCWALGLVRQAGGVWRWCDGSVMNDKGGDGDEAGTVSQIAMRLNLYPASVVSWVDFGS